MALKQNSSRSDICLTQTILKREHDTLPQVSSSEKRLCGRDSQKGACQFAGSQAKGWMIHNLNFLSKAVHKIACQETSAEHLKTNIGHDEEIEEADVECVCTGFSVIQTDSCLVHVRCVKTDTKSNVTVCLSGPTTLPASKRRQQQQKPWRTTATEAATTTTMPTPSRSFPIHFSYTYP